MTRYHCWIIIGPNNVRKGSTIRSLIGVSQKTTARVSLTNGQWLEFANVLISSVNEKQPVPTPEQWLQSLLHGATSARKNVIFPLRHDKDPRVPNAHDAYPYIHALDQAGAFIESIVTLGRDIPTWVPPLGVPFAGIPNSADTPTSVTAKQMRHFWGWE